MTSSATDLHDAKAMVIDGNPQSRSIIVNQLRDAGVGTIVQVSRLVDARMKLEMGTFDVVICEQYFEREDTTGQDLLDDLRRSGLLPFATIFIMATGEASYAKVAEAAESALDSYLLKPYTAAQLDTRLHQARRRKVSLQAIFAAVEKQAFEQAADLCLERFEQRGEFWLYAARVGAELLLRLERFADAQKLYEAVIAAKTLPWARWGVARAQIEAGQVTQAGTTLEGLINAEPGYADAYDVMGRAQIEMGQFDSAMVSYKMAADMTPASIGRLHMHAHPRGEPGPGSRRHCPAPRPRVRRGPSRPASFSRPARCASGGTAPAARPAPYCN